jgi:hypothetical protein
VSAAEQESAADSIRQIESRQDEVLRELDLLEQRLAALLATCATETPVTRKAA